MAPLADQEWVLRSTRVVLPNGMRPASIVVRAGRIQEIRSFDSPHDEDAGETVVMPGLVDTHVHVNEPGRTEWEGFETATTSAAAGGITTIIDMPLNSIPPTISVPALETKIAAASGKCRVDVGFWGGAVPGNLNQLKPLLEAGCLGFKCFLAPSGVDEFPHFGSDSVRDLVQLLAGTGAVLLVHAELPEYLEPGSANRRNYASYLNSRPDAAEVSAVEILLQLCEKFWCSVHIVHLSSAQVLRKVHSARARRLPITIETCPHYLALAAEDVPDGGTEFKCAPPIRETSNREALWDGLRDGVIDMIVSDHSPCPAEMKLKDTGDFVAAWGGIASLQLALPVVWTEATSRGFRVEDIARWMASSPARLAGLAGRKGELAPGCDADFFLWDPDEEFTVSAEALHHRHKLIPYAGRRLRGVVKQTYLGGLPVLSHQEPRGRILRRQRHQPLFGVEACGG